MARPNRDALPKTLTRELRGAWQTLNANHPGERFYSFGIYTTALAEYLTVTAATEEGLNRAAEIAVRRGGGTADLQRQSLRWSPADSLLQEEGEELLPNSNKIRAQGPDPYEDTPEADEAIDRVFDTAVEALRTLDEQGMFGTSEERESLVLCIWTGDQTREERLAFAHELNPASVVRRFERELDAAYDAFVALSNSA